MPSRAYTSFLRRDDIYINFYDKYGFNALSGLYLISTKKADEAVNLINAFQCPLGLIPHFYGDESKRKEVEKYQFQCPLGLIPHFYLLENLPRKYYHQSSFNALSGLYLISTKKADEAVNLINAFQCPLGLIPHFYLSATTVCWCPLSLCFNALSGLYLISTVPLQKPRFYAVSRACFCRYLSEYSDNSRFSCMLTFWTYLMRCTYP